MQEKQKITVGELIEHLQGHDPNAELIFSDDALDFYRLKKRGPLLVQMEFDQLVYKDKEGNRILQDG